jgi:thiol-disulfide isomerase/thioredoxin
MRVFTFLFCLLLSSAAYPAEEGPIAVTLPDLEGNEVDLASWRGQWLVLNFWATWCTPCIKEFPELDALHSNHDDITVVGLNFENADQARLEQFLQRYPVSYPILRVDIYAPPSDLGDPAGLPTTHLVDPEGRLRHTITGLVTEHSLLDALEGLGR